MKNSQLQLRIGVSVNFTRDGQDQSVPQTDKHVKINLKM